MGKLGSTAIFQIFWDTRYLWKKSFRQWVVGGWMRFFQDIRFFQDTHPHDISIAEWLLEIWDESENVQYLCAISMRTFPSIIRYETWIDNDLSIDNWSHSAIIFDYKCIKVMYNRQIWNPLKNAYFQHSFSGYDNVLYSQSTRMKKFVWTKTMQRLN